EHGSSAAGQREGLEPLGVQDVRRAQGNARGGERHGGALRRPAGHRAGSGLHRHGARRPRDRRRPGRPTPDRTGDERAVTTPDRTPGATVERAPVAPHVTKRAAVERARLVPDGPLRRRARRAVARWPEWLVAIAPLALVPFAHAQAPPQPAAPPDGVPRAAGRP